MDSEEIATIFVIGFPDDMKEREFQNMFAFASGFETAKLKIPAPSSPKKDGSANIKKQIIGFAKFRSRLEAIEARDILNSKKIDYGQSVLKADLAKKNLNSRKYAANSNSGGLGLSLNSPFPYSSRISSGYGMPSLSSTRPPNLNLSTPHPFDLFNDAPLFSAPVLKNSEAFNDNDKYFDSHLDSASIFESGIDNYADWNLTPSLRNTRVSSFRLNKTSNERLANIAELNGLSRPNLDLAPLRTRLGNLSINSAAPHSSLGLQPSISSPMTSTNNSSYTNSSLYSNGFISPAPGLTIQMPTTRSTNNSDRNPPCNTLYVGNLPASTTEDELRQLFQNVHGYKRMCFKAKPNSGPMCFVEFKDVSCATLAIRELDGHQLSNKPNGGIRLSYSKNPLGIKNSNSVAARRLNSVASSESLKESKFIDLKFNRNPSPDDMSINSSSFVSSLVSYGDNPLYSNSRSVTSTSGLLSSLKPTINMQNVSPNSITSMDSNSLDSFSKPIESVFIKPAQMSSTLSLSNHNMTQVLH